MFAALAFAAYVYSRHFIYKVRLSDLSIIVVLTAIGNCTVS